MKYCYFQTIVTRIIKSIKKNNKKIARDIRSKKSDKIKWSYFFYLFINNPRVEPNLIFETCQIDQFLNKWMNTFKKKV